MRTGGENVETNSDVDVRYLVGYFTDNELPLYPVKHFPNLPSTFTEGRKSRRSDNSLLEPSSLYARLPMDKRLVTGIIPSVTIPIRLLTERHPDSGLDADETDKNALKDLVSEWDEKHFTYEVSVRYFTAVVQAIRAVDPHHLVLGSRLHGAAKSNKYFNEI